MGSPYDLVGPVLPQALRLARYQALPKLPGNSNDIPSENDTVNQRPSREEERLLASNASVVSTLEDLFSWSYKDRTSRTSTLTRVESVRFQRAIYRIWLMSVLFGPRRFEPPHHGFYEDEEEASAYWDRKLSENEKGRKDQKSFLEQFSSQEIDQIDRLARFLTFLASLGVSLSRGTDYTYDWDGLYLFAGPHLILRCYEEGTVYHFPIQYLDDDGAYEKFLLSAADEIIKERKFERTYGDVGIILDDLVGEDDRCQHCGSAGMAGMLGDDMRTLPDLYNVTNWDSLRRHLLMDRQFLVERNLTYNITEKPILHAWEGDWSRLLHQMFACKKDEYKEWTKEDWYCTACYRLFFRDTIWRWRLARKERYGEEIKSDCKYGYKCKKQCFDKGLAHAKEFNHLCKPTEEVSPGEAWNY